MKCEKCFHKIYEGLVENVSWKHLWQIVSLENLGFFYFHNWEWKDELTQSGSGISNFMQDRTTMFSKVQQNFSKHKLNKK